MMRRLLLLPVLLTCVVIRSHGQVAFSHPDALPEEGTHNLAQRVAPWPNYSATPPWNFNSLSFGSIASNIQVWRPPAGTPYAAQVPQATHCLYDQLAFPIVYDYFVVGASGIQQVATGSTGGFFNFLDPWQVYVFPNLIATGYNDDYIMAGNTYQGIVNPLAKGTMLTPFGDHANVVLIEFGFNDGSGSGTVFTYRWFRDTNCMIPIAEYDPDTQQLTLNTPMSVTPLSVPEYGMPSVSMGPNPAPYGTVTLKWTGAALDADLRIVAVDGRVVYQQRLVSGPNGSIDLDLSSVAPGTYAVRMEDAGEMLWQQPLIVVR